MRSRFTSYWDDHGQKCPYCKKFPNSDEHIKLRTVSDNFSGGSHYWSLECVLCRRYYCYGTYNFELQESRSDGNTVCVAKYGKFISFTKKEN